MSIEKGTIAVQTENIFPIIKKFLYSDHEIFLRELVSNAVDATQKLKKLSSLGEISGMAKAAPAASAQRGWRRVTEGGVNRCDAPRGRGRVAQGLD
jgi:hypothetical protein